MQNHIKNMALDNDKGILNQILKCNVGEHDWKLHT